MMSSSGKAPNVAIIGRPNVGKSALFNRLVGRKIAIVHDHPGITRDLISGTVSRGAKPFTVWDTGGIIGAGESELIAKVRQKVENAMQHSEIHLFVVDAQEGLVPADRELARLLRKSAKPVILVVNKIDDAKHDDLVSEFSELGFENAVSISAEHNRGITDLIEQIERLLPSVPADQTATINPQPISIAVIGRPNAGKSSFINALLKDNRAIVSELPGTTREAVDILYERKGEQFNFIDTAGIRRRASHSSSAEVFSVMRAERSIRRAELCVLLIDLTSGLTAQDKRIAGLIQEAHQPCIIVLNKWDLFKPKRREKELIKELLEETRRRAFFLDYAPILIASARTRENVDRLFVLIDKIRRAARKRIGTGVLNRLLRSAFAANPPPMLKGRRLKLFYAAQAGGANGAAITPPEFVLFVNDPRLLGPTYRRYLEARIREAQPYPGLPILMTCRPRTEKRRP